MSEGAIPPVRRRGLFSKSRAMMVLAGSALAAAVMTTGLAQQPADSEPVSSGGPATLRRLSAAQYVASIHDVFGEGVKVGGRFDPELRAGGLLAIGDGKVAVSTSGLEQYELRGREISAQVLDGDLRKAVLPCAPAGAKTFDRSCAIGFFTKYGRLLYRRPLSAAELTRFVDLAAAATKQTGSFDKGMQAGLSRLLSSPNFVFRVERTEADPVAPGRQRLDAYSLATRISFLLWNAPPDAELLDAAAKGTLGTQAGLSAQVDRLIASPRFVNGVRAFFSDMLAYDQFDGLAKDQSIYAKYTSQLAKDAKEQMLRTIVDLLVTNHSDYRDLFTTRKTFINRSLGALYRVPVSGNAVDGWVPYTFGPDEPRAGILTFAAFLMLDPTHEGRSSPTIRGKSVREQLLCQPVPMPPPNVNFSLVQNTTDPAHKTARDRLSIHRENPVCAGCHAITDPIGLSMENYDAIGQYREAENGAPIDASGTFEGHDYHDVIALEHVLHDSDAAPSCLVQRAFEYGVGRQVADGEGPWLEYAARRFAQNKYALPDLMRRIATSQAFRAVSAAPGRLASK
jgi:hypothetical protein